MSPAIRWLLGGLLILGSTGCRTASSTRPGLPENGGGPSQVDARDGAGPAGGQDARGAVLPLDPEALGRKGVCPPGSLFDGVRCRRQRGVIIDQKDSRPLGIIIDQSEKTLPGPRRLEPDSPDPGPPALPSPLPQPAPTPPQQPVPAPLPPR